MSEQLSKDGSSEIVTNAAAAATRLEGDSQLPTDTGIEHGPYIPLNPVAKDAEPTAALYGSLDQDLGHLGAVRQAEGAGRITADEASQQLGALEDRMTQARQGILNPPA